MPQNEQPANSRVDITWIDMDAADAPVAEFWHTLGHEEQARARRFRRAKDQRRFIVRRGVLRALLAARIGCPPFKIRYTENEFGKLSVVGSDVRFNVSRSHSLALFALTDRVEVGCDVEQIDLKLDFEPIAQRYFAPEEVSILDSLPMPLRRDRFFRHWTFMEAYAKCSGTGLSFALDSVAIALTGDGTPLILAAKDFTCRALDAPPHFRAAVVAQARGMQVRVQTQTARAVLASSQMRHEYVENAAVVSELR